MSRQYQRSPRVEAREQILKTSLERLSHHQLVALKRRVDGALKDAWWRDFWAKAEQARARGLKLIPFPKAAA